MSIKDFLRCLPFLICGTLILALGIYFFSLISNVSGDASGTVVNTKNCRMDSCSYEYYKDGNILECEYSGNVTLSFEYDGKAYKEIASPETYPCKKNCCSKVRKDKTTVYIYFKDGNPENIKSFTDDRSAGFMLAIMFGLLFSCSGLCTCLIGFSKVKEHSIYV